MDLTPPFTLHDLAAWLREENPRELERLWAEADRVRAASVGGAVHLRGLIEISNHCVRQCAYCGLRHGHRGLVRYRMEAGEILECARLAAQLGYGTVVLQAGEDYGIEAGWMAEVVREIKKIPVPAVTLSLGERSGEDLQLWRRAGADRYLLRFETSDPELYARIHPALPHTRSDRVALLGFLKSLGYEVGSGVMVGIPGQSFETLARDIALFGTLDLDMIGVGPFIPHPDTPLGSGGAEIPPLPPGVQALASEEMVYKAIALTRLTCPQANIPSTTALATINLRQGRELGLMRGANVIMPNLTPVQYRRLYEIYPAKACIYETALECHECLGRRIASVGRTIGSGPGGRSR